MDYFLPYREKRTCLKALRKLLAHAVELQMKCTNIFFVVGFYSIFHLQISRPQQQNLKEEKKKYINTRQSMSE